MKKLYSLLTALVLTIAAGAQTLNVTLGNVTYQFPASQTGEMTYADGQTLTIMGKTFTLSDITSMTVDNSEVKANQVAVNYDGTSATVTVAGNVAQYVSATVSGIMERNEVWLRRILPTILELLRLSATTF